ncbi:hypothetical protein M569_06862, partial [Genlisea aurea]
MSTAERHSSSSSFAAPPDEANLFLDILQEAPLFGHRKRVKILGSFFYCFLLASYAVIAVVAAWILHSFEGFISPILCACDVILLLVTGIFQHYLVYQVQTIRLQGYYGFSQKLKRIVRLPYLTISYGTALMLLVLAWKPHFGILSISMLLRIIMLVEALCAGFFISIYIGYVQRYNRLDSEPDVLNSLYSPLQDSSAFEGLRYHEGCRLSDRQMALLQYQKENIHFLSEEILRLQECLNKYQRSDPGNRPEVDLAHLLSVRDQELRTLSAEMNQLQSELRLARSVIGERDSELQRYHNINKQYVEENERLRAILAEWSTRAAKLERALEAEHLSNLELQKR